MIRWRFSKLDITGVVVLVTLGRGAEILLDQGNLPEVTLKDRNNKVLEDGNHSATVGNP